MSIIEAGSCAQIDRIAKRLKVLGLPICGIADNDPTQPSQSVEGWGVSCDSFVIWPRHDHVYDLEGILAFGSPLDGILSSIAAILSASEEQSFCQAVINAAAAIDRTTALPWFTGLQLKPLTIEGLQSPMQKQTVVPNETMRAILKRAMSATLKHRRSMRLLASAMPLADVPVLLDHALSVVGGESP